MPQLKFILGNTLIFVIATFGCNPPSKSLVENPWQVDIDIAQTMDQQIIEVTNQTRWPLTAEVTYDGELIYTGIYTYDSLFCVDRKIRLSTISDFFNTKTDTIAANESQHYLTSLFTPYISEVLDSTSIFSFDFNILDTVGTNLTYYIVCARGTDGVHRMTCAAQKSVNSSGELLRFELSEALCGDNLLTVERDY